MEALETEGFAWSVLDIMRELADIEMKLARELGLPTQGLREEIRRRHAENTLPDTELVADWQESYAVYLHYAARPDTDGFRWCGFCGCNTNAMERACCADGRDMDRGLRQQANILAGPDPV